MKVFKIPCFFEQGDLPVDLYIGAPRDDQPPLRFQQHWLRHCRGGEIYSDVLESFQKLHDIAKNNNVSFEELCMTAIGSTKENEKEVAPSPIEEAYIEKVLARVGSRYLNDKELLDTKLVKRAVKNIEIGRELPPLPGNDVPLEPNSERVIPKEIEENFDEKDELYKLERTHKFTPLYIGKNKREWVHFYYHFCDTLFSKEDNTSDDARLLTYATAEYLFIHPEKSNTLPELYRMILGEDAYYRFCVALDTSGKHLNSSTFQILAMIIDSEFRFELAQARITSELIKFSTSEKIAVRHEIYNRWQDDLCLYLFGAP